MTDKRSPSRRKILKKMLVSAVGAAGFAISGSAASQPDQESTISFNQLSSEAKEIFKAGLSEGRLTTRERLPASLMTNDFVEFEGVTYRLNTLIRYLHRDRVSPEKVTEVDEKEKVRHFEDFASTDKAAFKKALETGSHTVERGPEVSFDFSDNYIEYNGEIYYLNYVHMDIPTWDIAPEKSELRH